MIAIAFTVSCRRPRYLYRCLESWSQVRGIRDAYLVLALEPVHPLSQFPIGQVRSYMARTFPGHHEITVASEPQGCTPNTRRALARAFQVADFAILAEEDIEVADDVLEYFAYAQRYQGSPDVLAVCANTREHGDGTEADVFTAPWFSPLVWGTWRGRHDDILAPAWAQRDVPWDGTAKEVLSTRQMLGVFPAWSRALHFGESSNMTPRSANGPNYFYRQALSNCYRPHYDPQEFRNAVVSGAVLY